MSNVVSIPTAATERARLVERARNLRIEIEYIFVDAEHWNRIYPAEPVDPDPDGQLRRAAKALDKMLAGEATR